MSHIILLGDSIFDNKSYVGILVPDVRNQVSRLLPKDSKATKLAIDGDVISGIDNQLKKIPSDATHLFVSIGGNDALGNIDILTKKVNVASEAFIALHEIKIGFEIAYSNMLKKVLEFGLPTTVCTIYYPRFDSLNLDRVSDYIENFEKKYDERNNIQRSTMSALAVYNDSIFKVAFENNTPVIDLRVLCNDEADFANPIEPSVNGGEKMAKMMTNIVNNNQTGVLVYS